MWKSMVRLLCGFPQQQGKGRVTEVEGKKVFKFGGWEKLKSLGTFELPAHLAGSPVSVRTDVVATDIPLLLSKEAIKRAKVKLNLVDDTAEILGTQINLHFASYGHYCVSLHKVNEVEVEEIYAVSIGTLDTKEQHQTLLKLRRQFAHPLRKKYIGLLKDAEVWSQSLNKVVDTIYASCDLCRVHTRTPVQPAVTLPVRCDFSEKSAWT